MKYLLILSIIFFAGCNSGNNSVKENNGSRTIEEINAAPEKVLIDTKHYIITADIWRDLMPSIDTSHNGIILKVILKTEDSSDIDTNLTVKNVWVIKNKDFWEAEIKSSTIVQPGVMEINASNGPKWKPREKVNVVLEIHKFRSGYLLQVKNVNINAVY